MYSSKGENFHAKSGYHIREVHDRFVPNERIVGLGVEIEERLTVSRSIE